jgi:putative SOS response-associated peptidase YedK
VFVPFLFYSRPSVVSPCFFTSGELSAWGKTRVRLAAILALWTSGLPRRRRYGTRTAMCNLYSIKTRRADLARKFGLSDNRMAAVDELAAIFPGHMAPVVKRSADGERELVLLSWGFVLLRKGYAPKRVTNARDDKIHTKFWKESFETRRCLVPATAFCEPDEGRPARWHWFALKGGDPLFAFPGVYRQWKGPIRKGGPNVDMERCSRS